MRSISLVVPGSLDQRTGGYIYDRRMVEGLRSCRWHVDVVELPGDFPHPAPDALEHASRAFERMPAGAIVVIDSLAFGAMPDLIEHESPRLRIVALIHLPLATESVEVVNESAAHECLERLVNLAEIDPLFDHFVTIDIDEDLRNVRQKCRYEGS